MLSRIFRFYKIHVIQVSIFIEIPHSFPYFRLLVNFHIHLLKILHRYFSIYKK